jgi:hypothetical protein
MNYYSTFTQVLGNPELKPVEIVLLSGNISIQTHKGDEIFLQGENMKDENLMPLLHETAETMRIDKHSLVSLIMNHEFIGLTIFIPESCDLYVLLRAGHLTLRGNFGQVRARTDAGNISTDLSDFTVKGQADLVVFAGEIKLQNSAVDGKTRHHHRHLTMKIGEEGSLKAKVSLGDIWMVA